MHATALLTLALLAPAQDDPTTAQPAGQQPSARPVAAEQYAQLLHKQSSLELELVKSKAILEHRRRDLETLATQPTSDKQIARLFKADPEVAQLIHDIQEVRRQTGLVSERIKQADDPTLRGYREKEAQLLAEYEQLWQTKKDEIAAELAANGQSPEGELLRAERQVSELELALNTTREHIALLDPAPAPAPAQDDAMTVARSVLDAGAALFNTKNAAAMAATYTEDGQLILYTTEDSSIKADARQGRAAIEQAYREIFKSEDPVHARNDVQFARFAGPDVLVIEGAFTLNTGIDPVPFTQVRVKQGDKWLLKHLQLYATR